MGNAGYHASNYCAEAIADFDYAIANAAAVRARALSAGISSVEIDRQMADALRLSKAIKASQKFRLPDGGLMLNWEGKHIGPMIRDYASPLRLPFPLTCFEFRGNVRDQPDLRLPVILRCYEEKTDDDRWNILIEPITQMAKGYGFSHMGVIFSLDDLGDGKFRSNIYAAKAYSYGDADGEVEVSMSAYATTVVAQVIAALRCKNVGLRTEAAPDALNRKRARSGKQPFFSYHVLEISERRDPAEDDLGGSHASPRVHLRRGHIRKHPAAGSIWVNACVVGNKALGMVVKDYKVKKALI